MKVPGPLNLGLEGRDKVGVGHVDESRVLEGHGRLNSLHNRRHGLLAL